MDPREEERLHLLHRLQSLLFTTGDITGMLQQVTELSAQLLAGEEMSCSITMRHDGNLVTRASSDQRALPLDEEQYTSKNGPCLTTLDTGNAVVLDDVTTERRWPEYVARARRFGLRSSLALPLMNGSATFGALNIYSFTTSHLSKTPQTQMYRLLAAHIATTLRLATRRASDDAIRRQLEEALTSRSMIDQALGILMARHHTTSETAFDLLRRQSQASHRKIRDIAADLIDQESGQQPDAGKPFDAT